MAVGKNPYTYSDFTGYGLQNFTRTSASILNLVLYGVPLVALTMGTLSFTTGQGID